MDVGSDHIWKNVLLCIGLRDARCTRLIGVSSPLSIFYMSQIVWSQLTVNFAANGVLDSSSSTEFLISVYFIRARYQTVLIEQSKALRYFLYHNVQHPKIPHSAHRLQFFRILCGSRNKQRLFFCSCLVCDMNWIFKHI